MAYEVTASRRRPQQFEDLAGQEFVVATLKNALQSGKIAPAYLFSGPRGCGKTSSARILAKALNCEKGPTPTPCGVCPACREITQGASLDVIEIDGASNTSVNDVRQIRDEVLFPPNSSRYKIYIIDEVHMLSNSAFNALLKTIEEPPPYVVFIFATTELHKVPATIKSRCQQFTFRLLSVDCLKGLLAAAAQEIGVEAEDEALFWIAREATGSSRDAYTLFDQVVAFSDNRLTYEKIRATLGLVGVEQLNELFVQCAAGNRAAALEKTDALLNDGISLEQLILNCADYLRSLLFIQSGIKKESLLGQLPERYAPQVLAAWDADRLETGLSWILQVYRDIRYSLNPRLEFEIAVSRLCWLREYVPPARIADSVRSVRALLAGNGSVSPRQDISGSAAAGETTRQTFAGSSAPSEPQKKTEGSDDPYTEEAFAHGENPFDVLRRAIGVPPRGDAVSPAKPAAGGNMEPTFAAPAEKPPVTHREAAAENSPAAAQVPVASQSASEGSARSAGLQQLCDLAIENLQKTKTSISTALLQARSWKEDNGVISCTVETAYLKNMLELETRAIGELFSHLRGSPVQFKPLMEVKHAEAEKTPHEVELLCKVFKGLDVTPPKRA